MSKAKRRSIEARIRRLRKDVHHLRLETKALREESRRLLQQAETNERSAGVKVTRASTLEDELRSIIGLVTVPDPPPKCWCCSCVNQSARHEGCKACWFRDDVQQWLDRKGETADHETGFACPLPGEQRCPGWEPK